MTIKETVEKIYNDYEKGNLPGVMEAIPDDFCFEWPFESRHAPYSGICSNKAELISQLQSLADDFQFNSYSATNIVAEGDKVAAQISLNLTSNKTGDTFEATIAHFWTFENSKPVKLVEYMDTAMMKHQCS